jgi:photosynthetic reaction center H subunit
MTNNTRADSVHHGDTTSLNTTASGALVHLGDLDEVRIADGEPDIRGWDVRGSDGATLGKVEDLLVDTGAMQVRYIEVKLDSEIARRITQSTPGDDADADRFALVPIGVARLDDAHDDVLLDAHAAQMAGIPAYHRDAITRDYERDVVTEYSRVGDGVPKNDVMKQAIPSDSQPPATRDGFYDDRTFDDRAFFGARRSRDDRAYLERTDRQR